MTADGPAVEVHGLTVGFPGRSTPSLDGVHLTVDRGERVLVVGPSGGGKSTLLHAVTGVVPQSVQARVGGWVRVLGQDPATTPVPRLALDVGWLGQDPAANACLPTVDDEVALPLENRGVPAGRIGPAVDAALDAVGAAHLRGRRTAALSGGEQQRVALAAVLAADPQVLLLDEPTSMLDPLSAEQVLRVLGERSAGRTTLLVEHRLDRMPWRPDRAVVLGPHGRIVADGASRHVLPPSRLAPRPAPSSAPTADRGEAVLRLRGAAFRQGGREVVRGVDLDLRRGELTVVVGTNGSGKSSLLLGMAGLLPGDVPVGAHDVGLVFQRPEHQFVARTVAAEVGHDPDRVLTRFGLDGLAAADPFRLSGGQQRRLSVAAVTVLGRGVLLLDEPTFGLDEVQTEVVVGLLLEQVRGGTAVALATHDLDLARSVAHQVVVLHDGDVLAVGDRRVLDDDDLLTAAGLR